MLCGALLNLMESPTRERFESNTVKLEVFGNETLQSQKQETLSVLHLD